MYNSALVNSKGIIVGRKGTIGKVQTETPFFIDTAYYVLPNDAIYNFDYMFYLCHLGLERLNEDSRFRFKQNKPIFKVYLPPKSTQKK